MGFLDWALGNTRNVNSEYLNNGYDFNNVLTQSQFNAMNGLNGFNASPHFFQSYNANMPAAQQITPEIWNHLKTMSPQAQYNALKGLDARYYQQNGKSFLGKADQGSGFGLNAGTFQLGMGLLQAGLAAYGAIQANKQLKLQKEAFDWQRRFAQRNLSNSVKDYNRLLESRTYRAAHWNGTDRASADAYIEKHKMSDKV